MIANSLGSVSDIVDDEYRAFAFSLWSIGPLNGPTFGPLIAGFLFQARGWRWINWLVLILSGIALLMICMPEETYTPAILRQKAKAKRASEDDPRYWSRYDDKLDFVQLMKVNLSRPFITMFTEPICLFWDLYVAVIYGILYLCFIAYPFVFSETRGWAPGISGLAFVGIGIGSFTAIFSEPLIRKMINSHSPSPDSGKVPLEATVSVICIAAILAPVGELWFAWTCVPASIHWAAPLAAGIPFGAGNTLVFIYASNYLAGCYGIYAASALAGNSVMRR
jgi:MFS family permease